MAATVAPEDEVQLSAHTALRQSGIHSRMFSAMAGTCREDRMRWDGLAISSTPGSIDPRPTTSTNFQRSLRTSIDAECILGCTAVRSRLHKSDFNKMRRWISKS